MKNTNILVFVIFFLASAVFAEAKRPVVALSTFEVKGGAIELYEADAIMELYTDALQQTRRVILVNRNIVDKTLKKMNFQEEDWLDSKRTKEVGNVVNAQFLIYGKIFGLGKKMYLSTWIIDAGTAEIVNEWLNFQFLFEFDGDMYSDGYVEAQNAFVIDPGIKTLADSITMPTLPYKFGDKGPGGGIVVRLENDMAIELSEPIAEVDFQQASSVCKDYRGGGYDGWYLPTVSLPQCIRFPDDVTKQSFTGKKIWAYAPDYTKVYKVQMWEMSSGNYNWSGRSENSGKAFVLAAREFKMY